MVQAQSSLNDRTQRSKKVNLEDTSSVGPAMKRIVLRDTIGALMIRIEFWGPLYYIHNKEPPKIVKVIIKAPIVAKNSDAPIICTLV